MCGNTLLESGRPPASPRSKATWGAEGSRTAKPTMNRLEESDRPVVSKKRPNKAGRPAAEAVERRGLVKGNSLQRDMHRMQGRARVRQALERIRQAAEREKGGKLTSLMHHIYSVDTLREAYYRLEREAAPGVDGITWRQYREELETNLQDLSGRLARVHIERAQFSGCMYRSRMAASAQSGCLRWKTKSSSGPRWQC